MAHEAADPIQSFRDVTMATIETLEISGSWLKLFWSDGHEQNLFATWLRDNAQTPDARNPANGQRLVDVSDVPEKTAFQDAVVSGSGALEVTFAPDGYRSVYTPDWLRSFLEDRRHAPSKTLWDASHAILDRSFEDVTEQPRALADWLGAVAKDGIALLRGVPAESEAVFRVADLFGYVRETNYGKLFDVRSVADPTNLAFTSQGLMVHTDNPYRNPVPGLQLLHCLQSDAEGGMSVFVDGFKAADRLRQEHAGAFEILSSVWVPFRFYDGEADLQSRTPIICVDDGGTPTAIRYNNRSVAPIDPGPDVEAFYDAYRKFSALLQDPAGEVTVQLGPGDCIVFDNERVLHGRKAFKQASRWLQGCYADKDSLLSKLRILNVETDP